MKYHVLCSAALGLLLFLLSCTDVETNISQAEIRGDLSELEKLRAATEDPDLIKRIELAKANIRDWHEVSKSSDPTDYKQYISSHPSSAIIDEAESVYALLRAKKSDTIGLYQKYLEKYPDSTDKQYILKRLTQLEPTRDLYVKVNKTNIDALLSFSNTARGTGYQSLASDLAYCTSSEIAANAVLQRSIYSHLPTDISEIKKLVQQGDSVASRALDDIYMFRSTLLPAAELDFPISTIEEGKPLYFSIMGNNVGNVLFDEAPHDRFLEQQQFLEFLSDYKRRTGAYQGMSEDEFASFEAWTKKLLPTSSNRTNIRPAIYGLLDKELVIGSVVRVYRQVYLGDLEIESNQRLAFGVSKNSLVHLYGSGFVKRKKNGEKRRFVHHGLSMCSQELITAK